MLPSRAKHVIISCFLVIFLLLFFSTSTGKSVDVKKLKNNVAVLSNAVVVLTLHGTKDTFYMGFKLCIVSSVIRYHNNERNNVIL